MAILSCDTSDQPKLKGNWDDQCLRSRRNQGVARPFDVAAQRGLTPFVGREHELEQLQRTLEQVNAENGQIVAVRA
jgi:hypothetical protein